MPHAINNLRFKSPAAVYYYLPYKLDMIQPRANVIAFYFLETILTVISSDDLHNICLSVVGKQNEGGVTGFLVPVG